MTKLRRCRTDAHARNCERLSNAVVVPAIGKRLDLELAAKGSSGSTT